MSQILKGRTFSVESLALMSLSKIGENNPMFGVTGKNSPMFGRTGENNPMFGKTHTAEVKALISKVHKGNTVSAESKALISEANGSIIYVYDKESNLVNTFNSARKAAEHFNCHHTTIMKYVKNNKLYQDQWILSISLITNNK